MSDKSPEKMNQKMFLLLYLYGKFSWEKLKPNAAFIEQSRPSPNSCHKLRNIQYGSYKAFSCTSNTHSVGIKCRWRQPCDFVFLIWLIDFFSDDLYQYTKHQCRLRVVGMLFEIIMDFNENCGKLLWILMRIPSNCNGFNENCFNFVMDFNAVLTLSVLFC